MRFQLTALSLFVVFLLASCSVPSLPSRDESGANTTAVGKVSGRSYYTADNSIQILFNNPWIPLSKCSGELEEENVCDVAAGSTPEQTDNNADARAINSVVANLIRQSAIDVIEGYLPQNTQLDVASQNLDNERITESLEFAIENGVHVRFVGNRDNDEYDDGDAASEEADDDQYKPAKDYDYSDMGFGDIAGALDDYYPAGYYSGSYVQVEREEFPLPIGESEFNYGTSFDEYSYTDAETTNDSITPGLVNRFFFSGRDESSTNLDGVSDFNLVNQTGQMHHKFMLIKTRKRDSHGLPVSSNGNPVIVYNTVTGSTNLTDNGYYRNNNNIIIFTEEREYDDTDGDANDFADMEEITITSNTNRCPLDSADTKPCLYNTYKRQMNYLLSDYDDSWKAASNAPLESYAFDDGITLDVYFADYQSEPIIPRITDEALKAQDSIYFMAFSFSTATTANDSGVKLHEALGPKHPLRGLISVKGLMTPDRTENEYTQSALVTDAEIYEYDNQAQDPDFSSGGNRLHHKVMIIDPCYDNGTVITGSANWSETVDGRSDDKPSSGNEYEDPHAYTSGTTPVKYTKGTHNNEDIIIIHSQEVAEIYYEQEFRYLVNKAGLQSMYEDLPLCSN